jgi:hypothetical protein
MIRLSRVLTSVGIAAVLLIVASPSTETAAIQRVVRLRNAFVNKYKNRATVQGLTFRIDHVKKKVNSISSGGEDGDLHMSGRPGAEVALPMVAELVNAGMKGDATHESDARKAVTEAHSLDGTSQQIVISGVWRLWFEHPPSTTLVQGHTVPLPTNTNPDHIFEVHPLTDFNGQSVASAFVPIGGYTAYIASKAFSAYEKLEFRVKKGSSFTMISSTQVGYNYTEFDAQLAGTPIDMNDGFFVLADILNKAGNSVVAAPRRLVIAKGTQAATAFKAKQPKKGTKLKVLGIPRVNLDKLMDEAEQAPGETVAVKGSYEMIVVGVR